MNTIGGYAIAVGLLALDYFQGHPAWIFLYGLVLTLGTVIIGSILTYVLYDRELGYRESVEMTNPLFMWSHRIWAVLLFGWLTYTDHFYVASVLFILNLMNETLICILNYRKAMR